MRLGLLVADDDLALDRKAELAPQLHPADHRGDVREAVLVRERVGGARRAVSLTAEENHALVAAAGGLLDRGGEAVVVGVAGALARGDVDRTVEVPALEPLGIADV